MISLFSTSQNKDNSAELDMEAERVRIQAAIERALLISEVKIEPAIAEAQPIRDSQKIIEDILAQLTASENAA